MKETLTRRGFIQKSVLSGLALSLAHSALASSVTAKSKMKFGLVTYRWGEKWDLPTLISNCEKTGYAGVELRTEHAHGVEINLSAIQRKEVKKRFEDSSVTCVGYGSNFEYHSPDQAILLKNIEQTKAYVQLCKDIGATGIKVKPNALPAGVAPEKTISQIANSLNQVGSFAKDCGQLIRVEVHGTETARIENMKAIFDQVTEPNVKICWNCNPQDLLAPGFEQNFKTLQPWFGDTVHVHELETDAYPYSSLMKLFMESKYAGWILLEASTNPQNITEAMKEQLALFKKLTK